ncbi:MAG: type II secretion system F family protein [Patescibacteria group bacterium]|nr:type II secretion system F family protein [Patescibacteria group bacterium]
MNKLRNFFLKIFKPASLQERINFARHLSVTIKSGLPIIEALRLIRRQTRAKRFAKVIDTITDNVNSGQSLAQSLENFSYLFSGFFVNMVRVGEKSGTLSSTLLHLSQELKKQKEINHQIRSALIYPAVILFATLGVTLFLTLFIFPKILPIFVSLNVELPFTTQLLIKVLTLLSSYGFVILGGVIAFVILIQVLLTVKKIHFVFDRALLSFPFISGIIIDVTMVNFSRSLGILLKSGMTIIDALTATRGTVHNLYYRYLIDQMIERVKKGEEIARYLAQKPKFFPPMLVGMIEVGESTGNLEQNLLYLSEYYESEIEEIVKNFTTILEPLLLLFMGLLVGFVAISIITPIYKVTQGLRF